MNADGSGKLRLARGNGTRLVAGRADDSLRARPLVRTRSQQIYVMNADGSGQRRLAAGTSPAWSPDGQTIVFQRSPGWPGELLVMNADGKGLRTLGVVAYGGPSWSPDGGKIAFGAGAVSGNGSLRQRVGPDIHVMNADGSGLRRLTHRPGWESSPLWSPAGSAESAAAAEAVVEQVNRVAVVVG